MNRCFLAQVPLVVVAFIFAAWTLENSTIKDERLPVFGKKMTRSKLARIDFIGAMLITIVIIGFLLGVDLPGQGKPWTSALVDSLIVGSIILGAIFLLYEGKQAIDPIFPPRLLIQRDVATTYSIMSLQLAAQLGVCTP